MTKTPSHPTKQNIYQIQVQGRLREGWSDWFYGMALETDVTSEGVTVTILTGPVADQAALHGLLARIRDLGLPLLRVERVDQKGAPQ